MQFWREGLVDTGGENSRDRVNAAAFMKALEDLVTHYDSSVRNAVGGMVQFTYGGRWLDPGCLEGDAQQSSSARMEHARVG